MVYEILLFGPMNYIWNQPLSSLIINKKKQIRNEQPAQNQQLRCISYQPHSFSQITNNSIFFPHKLLPKFPSIFYQSLPSLCQPLSLLVFLQSIPTSPLQPSPFPFVLPSAREFYSSAETSSKCQFADHHARIGRSVEQLLLRRVQGKEKQRSAKKKHIGEDGWRWQI